MIELHGQIKIRINSRVNEVITDEIISKQKILREFRKSSHEKLEISKENTMEIFSIINKIGKKGVTSTRRVSTKIITDVLGKSLTTAVKLACNPEKDKAFTAKIKEYSKLKADEILWRRKKIVVERARRIRAAINLNGT